jgi:putative hydrolase of the HAD superfamily
MSRYRALLLDAFGTLIVVDQPARRLQRAVAERLAAEVPLERAAEAMRCEIRHYQANCRSAVDEESLAALRGECAAIVMSELGLDADRATALAVLADAVVIRAYPDAPGTLAWARSHGLLTAVVSNGDWSLPEVLSQAGLLVDAVVDSATAGAAKPDPAIFHAALARLGVSAQDALHVGDDPRSDVNGARAAGIDALLLDRSGGGGGAGTIATLDELRGVVA